MYNKICIPLKVDGFTNRLNQQKSNYIYHNKHKQIKFNPKPNKIKNTADL